MGTFEVLRYSDTDITDAQALVRLPMDVIDRFWQLIHSPEERPLMLHHAMCPTIARWAQTAETTQEQEYGRNLFLRALREVQL